VSGPVNFLPNFRIYNSIIQFKNPSSTLGSSTQKATRIAWKPLHSGGFSLVELACGRHDYRPHHGLRGSGGVLSEYRGSQTIERYVDPSDPRGIPVYATLGQTAPSIETYYQYRVLSSKSLP